MRRAELPKAKSSLQHRKSFDLPGFKMLNVNHKSNREVGKRDKIEPYAKGK